MACRNLSTALTFWGAVIVPVMVAAQLPLPHDPKVNPALRFGAASIKTFNGNEPTRIRVQPSGRLDVSAAPVRILLQNAFRVRGDQIVGLPDWGNEDRYSITAAPPDGANVSAVPTMLANLLADRFNLAMHRETREMETFDLLLARDDGTLGPSLRPTSAECQALIGTGAPATAAAPPAADQGPCGSMQTGPGITRAAGVPLARLVQMLSQFTGRPVSDRTGLTGLHDFTLTFNPALDVAAGADSSDAPHVFTALQEQLGLRLSSQRGLVEIVVIDRIEKPTVD